MGRGLKCLCGFCPTRVSHKSYCAKCPNKPADYVNPAREQILASKAKYRASELGHATQAKYIASDLGQTTRAAYRASDLGQASQAASQAKYIASDLGQTTRAAYSASDLGQASQAAYQAAYQADYRANIAKELRKQAEAWQKEHGNGREALDDEAAQAEVSDRDLFSPCKAC
jgi:hypothetical protein